MGRVIQGHRVQEAFPWYDEPLVLRFAGDRPGQQIGSRCATMTRDRRDVSISQSRRFLLRER